MEDEKKALKLSHHPDGFLQFSGEGIVSGKNTNGLINGLGMQSWPLFAPPNGPAFSITIQTISELETTKTLKAKNCVLELVNSPIEIDDVILDGFYIPKNFETHIFLENQKEYILRTHPSGIVTKLQVLRPNKFSSISSGFIGLHAFLHKTGFKHSKHSCCYSTSTGNLKRNWIGRIIKGTGLVAMYPNPPTKRTDCSLNYKART